MKNFYEATVIKPKLRLNLELVLRPIGTLPCLVRVNNQTVFEDTLSTDTTINHSISLNDPIDLSIQIYRHHPDAVDVSLSIEGREVLPKYVSWANPPTTYLNTSGSWTLKIPNFYTWFHEVSGQGWII